MCCRAAWQVIGRHRALVIVNQRLERAELRARLEPELELVRSLVVRGQRSVEFDPELPPDWLIGILTDMIHAASREVTAGAMDADVAERMLLPQRAPALSSHRR